jgi:hypothetical protein
MIRPIALDILIICCGSVFFNAYASGTEGLKNEKVTIVSDRNYYIAGEEILFRAFNNSSQELKELNWSKVLYVELIASSNKSVSKGKFEFSSEGSEGTLKIPKEIPSGYYYLKAYTRWMRNFPATEFAWVSLKILNPYTEDVLIGSTNDTSSLITKTTVNYNTTTRELVDLHIDLSNAPDKNIIGACMAVVRKGTKRKFIEDFSLIDSLTTETNKIQIRLLPETRGESLNGKVIDVSTGNPVPMAMVLVSELGENLNLHCVFTNEEGEFHMPLSNYEDNVELFASVEKDELSCSLLIENEFSTRPLKLPSIKFGLKDYEKDLLKKMIIGARIAEMFKTANSNIEVTDSTVKTKFYGEPDIRIELDKYVTLPNLDEIFFEFVPPVSVRRIKGKPRFIVYGKHLEVFPFSPLVLLDQVPVSDIEAILNIHPSKIESIDILNVQYQKGDVVFGGIIALNSKKGDLAGIDLPQSSLFLEFSTAKKPVGRKGYNLSKVDNHHALYDNTIYWEPSIDLKNKKSLNLSFYSGDEYGDFEAWLTVVSKSGECYFKCTPFSVKKP